MHIKQLYAFFLNVRFVFKRRPTRIRYIKSFGVFEASDGKDNIIFCRLIRASRYKKGIVRALEGLARDYHLDKIRPIRGGVLIDCGANVGELGYWARQNQLSYIAFEPEPLEATCCDLNNYSGQTNTHRMALWKEDTELEFYSLPNTADGSIFNMSSESKPTKVKAVTMDSTMNLDRYKGTKILKLEAEGAEPEILDGAHNTLKQLDYVSVDCGYERGHEKSHTFMEVHEKLSGAGFEIVHAQFRRVIFMYKNMN